MANCCGGKNAGKPISWGRYAAGLGVFVGYHGAMRVLLEAASRVSPDLKKVRDFHKSVFETELKEVLRLEDINVNGRLGAPSTPEGACEVNPRLGEVVAVRAGEAMAPRAEPRPAPTPKRRKGRPPLGVVSPV